MGAAATAGAAQSGSVWGNELWSGAEGQHDHRRASPPRPPGFYREPVCLPAGQPMPVQYARGSPAHTGQQHSQNHRSGYRGSGHAANDIGMGERPLRQPARRVDPDRHGAARHGDAAIPDFARPGRSIRRGPPNQQHCRPGGREGMPPGRGHKCAMKHHRGCPVPRRGLRLRGPLPAEVHQVTDNGGQDRAADHEHPEQDSPEDRLDAVCVRPQRVAVEPEPLQDRADPAGPKPVQAHRPPRRCRRPSTGLDQQAEGIHLRVTAPTSAGRQGCDDCDGRVAAKEAPTVMARLHVLCLILVDERRPAFPAHLKRCPQRLLQPAFLAATPLTSSHSGPSPLARADRWRLGARIASFRPL
jgi:hypothetical protein